ncbi:hypothetical protein, partial [Pseudomonas putida]|uniref:hypothetical protein n=1 Tax=Pseudomonas putida TaxID=303 RepID=UPI0019558AC9
SAARAALDLPGNENAMPKENRVTAKTELCEVVTAHPALLNTRLVSPSSSPLKPSQQHRGPP